MTMTDGPQSTLKPSGADLLIEESGRGQDPQSPSFTSDEGGNTPDIQNMNGPMMCPASSSPYQESTNPPVNSFLLSLAKFLLKKAASPS